MISYRSLGFLLSLTVWVFTVQASAHPVVIDARISDWSNRLPSGDNLGLVSVNRLGLWGYSWNDARGDARPAFADPEEIADLVTAQATASPDGLSFMFILRSGTATSAPVPVQVQIAIDTDRVTGSGQTAFAGSADTSVAPAAAWEFLVQTQFTAGRQALVYDRDFAVQGAPVPVGADGLTQTVMELTVPWSRLGMSGPPPTPLRFTVATFREQSGGSTLDVGGPTVPNALDVISDYGAPHSNPPYASTASEFTAPGDRSVDYSFDLWLGPSGDPYPPLLLLRFVTVAVGRGWIALRNMTPAPLPLADFRLSDETAPGVGYGGASSLPSGAVLGVGAYFILAVDGARYAARYGELPDAEMLDSSAALPRLTTYLPWGVYGFGFGDIDEILVLDRAHTVVDVNPYGPWSSYPGMTSSAAPAPETASSRSLVTFADTDNRLADFRTVAPLCADDAECGSCGTCVLNACEPRAAGSVCRAVGGPCDVPEVCDGVARTCPADRFVPPSTVCRASASGGCDVAETCTGESASCPPDVGLPAGSVCRPSAGPCDVAEACDATSAPCPADGLSPSTTTCRMSAGACDIPETCTGSSTACPPDSFATAGTVCRSARGPCDVSESCDGTSSPCPADILAPAGIVCRPAASTCDLADTCDGATASCPDDHVAAAGAPCADGLACNGDETCDGAGACRVGTAVRCPPSGMACRDNVCTEALGGCAFVSAAAGAACGDGDPCNGDEVCDGLGGCLMGTPPLDGGSRCADASADVEDALDSAPMDGDMMADLGAADAAEASVPTTDSFAEAEAAVSDAARDIGARPHDTTAMAGDDAAPDAPGPSGDTTPDAHGEDVPLPRMTGPDGGCGCRAVTPARSPQRIAWEIIALLATAVYSRRRRRLDDHEIRPDERGEESVRDRLVTRETSVRRLLLRLLALGFEGGGASSPGSSDRGEPTLDHSDNRAGQSPLAAVLPGPRVERLRFRECSATTPPTRRLRRGPSPPSRSKAASARSAP